MNHQRQKWSLSDDDSLVFEQGTFANEQVSKKMWLSWFSKLIQLIWVVKVEDVTLEDVRKSLVPAFVILNWEKCKVERINNVFKAKICGGNF